MKFNTRLLHDKVTREKFGATLPPIYQSSAFEQKTAEDLAGIFENKKMGYCYTRVANPTVAAFEKELYAKNVSKGRKQCPGDKILWVYRSLETV